MKSSFSKVLAAGVVVAACIGGAALSASAASTESAPSGEVKTNGHIFTGRGTLAVHNSLELGSGVAIESERMTLGLLEDADDKPTEMVATWGSWSSDGVAAVAYPIMQSGQATGFYVKPKIRAPHALVSFVIAGCEVYKGIPGDGGTVHPESTSPFSCVTTKHTSANNWVFEINPTGR